MAFDPDAYLGNSESEPVKTEGFDPDVYLGADAPKEKLKESMYVAAQRNPDEHAKTMDLSKKTGVPSSLITPDTINDVKQKSILSSVNYDHLIKTNPRTAEWLQLPDNASISHDDIPALQKVEKHIKDYGLMESAWRAWTSGANQVGAWAAEAPAYAYDVMVQGGHKLPGPLKIPGVIAEILKEKEVIPERAPLDWRENAIYKNQMEISQAYEIKEDNMDWLDEAIDGDYSSLEAGLKTSKTVGRVMFMHAVKNAPLTVGLLAAHLSGAGAAGLGAAGMMAAGEKAKQLQKENPNLSAEAATVNATLTGALEAGTEALPLKYVDKMAASVFKKYGKQTALEVTKDFLLTIVGGGLTEGTEELVNSVGEDIVDRATNVTSEFDYGASFKKGVTAFGEGFVSGKMFTGPTAAMAAVSRMNEKRSAEAGADFVSELNNQVMETKLHTRSKDAKKDFIKSQTKGTDAEHIRINADAFVEYFQDKDITPAEAARILGVSKELDEAIEHGGEIKVPTHEWVSEFGETPHLEGLRKDVIVSPDPKAMSINEIDISYNEAKELMEKEAADSEAQVEADGGVDVVADRAGELLQTGRFTPQEARDAAVIQIEQMRYLSEQTGTPLAELMREFPLSITGGQGMVPGGLEQQGLSDRLKISDAGSEIDGLTVSDESIPNMDSISASLYNYEILEGVRSVDMSEFDTSKPTFYSTTQSDQVSALSEEIKNNKKITPLIVVYDSKGPYILEGGHRFDALKLLGKKSFPALVVVDKDKSSLNQDGIDRRDSDRFKIGEHTFANREEMYQHQLKHSKMTGLKNYDSFKEEGSKAWPDVGFFDIDGFKAINHDIEYENADVLIGRIGKIIRDFQSKVDLEAGGIRLYHRSGDEFLVRAQSNEIAVKALTDIQQILHGTRLTFKGVNNKWYYVDSIRVSTGVGKNESEAVEATKKSKAERLKSGLRKEPRPADDGAKQSDHVHEILGLDDAGNYITAAGRFPKIEENAGPDGTTTLYQSPTASPLGFYSQLEHEVSKMDFAQVPAKDLLNRIKNIQGIKKEELETLGIEEWLKAVEGKVTKQEVLDFIKNNGVQVEQVVLSKDFEGSNKLGDLSWSEPKRTDLNDQYQRQSNIENEMDYYISQPEDAFNEGELLQWKTEADEAHPDDEKAAEEAYDDKIREEAEKRATENVESDEYYGARYEVELGDTGFTLEGSDEYGWSAELTEGGRTKWKEFGSNLNEAQIQYMAHLIENGDIEGDTSELSKVEDLEWRHASAAKSPSESTIAKKAKEFLAKKEEEYRKSSEEGYPEADYPDEKDRKKRIENNIKWQAKREARESYDDPNNKRNMIEVRIDHPVVEGKLVGNNVKGWKLTVEGSHSEELTNKDLEAAQKEAADKMVSQGFMKAKKEVKPGQDINKPTGESKWQRYVVPGGENYREVLLTLPKSKEQFTYRTHFDEPNVLAHVRLTDRIDGKGRKTLFIEELQSDWHQQGREKGYKSPDVDKKISDLKAKLEAIPEIVNFETWIREKYRGEKKSINHATINRHFADKSSPEVIAYNEYQNDLYNKKTEISSQITELRQAVPNAPFKNTEAWAALAMKRMIKMAVEQGYEAVAWSPADVHVERWGTDAVSWVKKNDFGFEIVDKRTGKITDRGLQSQNKAHIQSIVDKYPDPENYEVRKATDYFLVGSAEQRGGNADGMNIEELARQRGKLLERNGDRVTTKEELREAIASTLSRERNDRSLESLTERVWKQMQAEDQHTGAVMPRKEGMEFFYNKMIPDVTKKILKKLDPAASVEVGNVETGKQRYATVSNGNREGYSVYDSKTGEHIHFPDDTHNNIVKEAERLNKENPAFPVLEIPITEAVKEKAAQGFTLFQPGQDDGPRGSISFDKDLTSFLMKFSNAADASTAIHEFTHYQFKLMGKLAQSDKASPVLKQHYSDLLEWVGAKPGDELSVDQEELIARGFETYMFEGKAPNEKLEPIFARFKMLLLKIYKSMASLKAPLNDQVRRVFDSWLTAEDMVAKAQSDMHQEPLFSEHKINMRNDKRAQKYYEATAEAKALAEGKVTQRIMDQYKKEKSAEYAEERSQVRERIDSEVSEQNIYKVINTLRRGKKEDGSPIKLSKAGIIKLWGSEGFQKIKDMPGPYIYARDGGMLPDEAASYYGFENGDDLLTQILNTPEKDVVVDQLTDQVMEQMHPDPQADGTLPAEAIEAIHNDKRAQILRMELEELAENHMPDLKEGIRRVARRPPTDKMVRQQANRIIGSKNVNEISPHVYLLAERKAAKMAGEALTKRDSDPFEHKQRELLNHELYRSSLEARRYIEKKLQKFKRLARTDEKVSQTRNVDLINAARSLLALYGIGKQGKAPSEYLASLKRYDEDAYNNIEELIKAASENAGPYQEKSFNDFVDLVSAVEALDSLSKSLHEIEVDGKKLEVDQAINTLVSRMDQFKANKKHKDQYDRDADERTKTWHGLLSAKAMGLRYSHWITGMDGGRSGEFRNLIYQPLSDAKSEYDSIRGSYHKRYNALAEKIRNTMTHKEIKAPEFNFAFKNKAALLGAIRHIGNSSNKKKLLVGRGWGTLDADGNLDSSKWDQFLDRMFREGVITEADMDFIQAVWDLNEELKPAAQKAHHKIFGYYFNEITREPVKTPWKTYEGGYVPAKIDPNPPIKGPARAHEVADRQRLEEMTKGHVAYTWPASGGSGFGKNRVENFNKPLSLDLNQALRHIDEVLRFTYLKPAVVDAAKVVLNPSFRHAMNDVDSAVIDELIRPALNRADKDSIQSFEGHGPAYVAKMANHLKNVSAMQLMFANIPNIVEQLTGFLPAATAIGGANPLKDAAAFAKMNVAAAQYMRSPKKMTNEISEKSKFMKSRFENHIFDLEKVTKDIFDPRSKIKTAQDFAAKHVYFGQIIVQNGLDAAIWTAAYNDGITKGLGEKKSIRRADTIVLETQGTMRPMDVSRVDANPFMRIFQMFYGYFNNLANLNAASFKNLYYEEMGLPKKAAKGFYLYWMQFAALAIISAALKQMWSGKDLDDDDDGEVLDDAFEMAFGAQLKQITAMLPGGAAIMAGLNWSNDKIADDRASQSPAIDAVTKVVGTLVTLPEMLMDEKDLKARQVRDTMTALGLLTGLPVGVAAKPINYMRDVNAGRAEPKGALDYTRGLVTGQPGQ
jgi:GGDEF domain-containing protein